MNMRSSARPRVVRISFVLTIMLLAPLVIGSMLNATGLFAAERAVSVRIIQGIAMVPLVCYCIAIGLIARAFAVLDRGGAVERVISDLLIWVGACLLAGGVFRVVGEPMLTRLILDRPWPYMNFDLAAMTLAVLGLMLILLGGPLRDAARMRDELKDIV
jgi:hypothetical protein